MPKVAIRSFFEAREPSVDRRFRPRPTRKVNLVNRLAEIEDEEEDDEDSWSDTGSESGTEITASSTGYNASTTSGHSSSEGAVVYLRLRPVREEAISPAYASNGNVFIARNAAKKNGKSVTEKHFTFTDILDDTVPQCTVYDTCIRHAIEAEENLTVLTYGTSGSGKTHTQIGQPENPGVIPRAIEHIFSYYGKSVRDYPFVSVVNAAINFLNDDEIRDNLKLRKKVLTSCGNEQFSHEQYKNLILSEHDFQSSITEGKNVFVWISFAEIYNENVYDLLNPSYEQQLTKQKGLTIVTNKGQVSIKNLTSVCVSNSREAQLLLNTGTQRITFGETAVNKHSSRSHFVFFIDVITHSQPDTVDLHSYRFCDLAGSERLDKTKNVGNRLKEAQRINSSLLVLGRCLDAVYHNQQKKNADIVPYRDSKLTTLIQAPLIGKEKMTMIVNINPSDEYFEENLNVLSFASIAKNIVFKEKPKKETKRLRYSWLAANPVFNMSDSINESYELLREENNLLHDQNEKLNNEITRLDRALVTQEMDLRRMFVNENEERMRRLEDNMQKRLQQQEKFYEGRIRILKEQIENQKNYFKEMMSEQNGNNEADCSSIQISDSGSDSDSKRELA